MRYAPSSACSPLLLPLQSHQGRVDTHITLPCSPLSPLRPLSPNEPRVELAAVALPAPALSRRRG
uniref:Uncharacterized protein n=1 Tax=uncultured marine virus TaxID=186617 RepID=A0A0F7L565_9VIRU|nr:hypothetical protein [uncultured marine virus]